METVRLSPQEYRSFFSRPGHVYNSVEFNLLNAAKVEEVMFLGFRSGKMRGGIILGRRSDGSLVSGFSAPFGGFDFVRTQEPVVVTEMAAALRDMGAGSRIIITLQPECYTPADNATVRFALQEAGFTGQSLVNHIISPCSPDEYDRLLDSKARNKLLAGLRADYRFAQCGAEEAYAVIRANRQRRGFYLAMTLDEVLATQKITHTEFYMLEIEGKPVAAAMTNRVTDTIVQLVYWGDTGEFASLHPMNLLARELTCCLAPTGCRILDLGPSGSFGDFIPSLASFKSSIGATVTLKHRFIAD